MLGNVSNVGSFGCYTILGGVTGTAIGAGFGNVIGIKLCSAAAPILGLMQLSLKDPNLLDTFEFFDTCVTTFTVDGAILGGTAGVGLVATGGVIYLVAKKVFEYYSNQNHPATQ